MGISMNIPLSMQLVDTWLLCLPTSPVASGHSKREHQHHVTLLYSGKEDTIQLRLFQRCIDLLLVMIIMIEAFQTEWDSIRTPILARLCTSGTIRVQMAFAFVLSGACRAVVGRWMDKDGLRISEVRLAFSGLWKKGLAHAPDSAVAVNYTLLSRGRGISRMLSGCRALQCRKPVWAPPTPRFLVELCRFTLWFNCLMTELDFLMLRYDLWYFYGCTFYNITKILTTPCLTYPANQANLKSTCTRYRL